LVKDQNIDLVGVSSAHFNNADLKVFEKWNAYSTQNINTVNESQILNEQILAALGKSDIPHPLGSDRQIGRAWGQIDARPSEASKSIVEAVKKLKDYEKLDIITLGALSNLASALLESPEILPKIRVFALGARFNPQSKVWNKNEFNIRNDLNAFDYLLNLVGLDLTIMPLDAAFPLQFRKKATLDRLNTQIAAENTLIERWNTHFPTMENWIMWDLAVVEAYLNPRFCEVLPINTPPENHQRKIKVYTKIDEKILEDDFWRVLKFVPSPLANEINDKLIIDKSEYANRLYGFWLGQCIANWTGLITEMDKIGIPDVNGKGAGFYTRQNWGGPDEPNLWGSNNYSPIIDFYLVSKDGVWGADDDTDIEYIYQELLLRNNTSILNGKQIRDGWLRHINKDEENFLWVSNQKAFDLMQKGMLPPATSDPKNNPEYDMIDAQLTTEIFGFFAPARPDIALKMAYLPIRTTAAQNAAMISEFYVNMYSFAALEHKFSTRKEHLEWMAEQASKRLDKSSYSYKMYEFVKQQYKSGVSWEAARDALHTRYQINQEDGYTWSSREKGCNGCFAAGINFGASLISLFYGEGNLKETIKIGVLCGWDSDNPTATWGGLLGFLMGKNGIETSFGQEFSDKFNIHRTRQGFSNNGIDTFDNMARKGIKIVDRVVKEQIKGGIDQSNNTWTISLK
jgi:inosine-uridine nucleoside N-ribohydrolase